ncbi:CALCIUM UNIPORTER PROTEIN MITOCHONDRIAL [Salix koriyanagi]|uniref:CALCIUM UNIPORTER PROTEIN MITOCHONDRIAL n=1 Tax=Salix koriyanagi TaxID=2511006 RepID=A0A9Q0NI09_9ROSI|nr:CALCIUM UNIPORTER PROTEIN MITOCHONDRIAL [Salix koriyanagi]
MISQTIATPDDPRRKHLEHMEKLKVITDRKARTQVGGELYCGLGWAGLSDDPNTWIHEAHLLGTQLGCNAADMFLCHLPSLRNSLRFLPENIHRAFFSSLLPATLQGQTKETREHPWL